MSVSFLGDVVNGDTSSIAALIASDGGDGISLREAVVAANKTAGADSINLPAGTFVLTAGELNITDSLTINGLDPSLTKIDGNGSSRVFHTRNAIVVNLSKVTIQNGTASDNGGAVFVDNSSTLNIIDSILTNNDGQSGRGGAIHVHGTLNLDRVLLSNNAAKEGGAIYFHGADGGTLTNVTISGNTASNRGGGVWTDIAITVKNSTIAFNTAPVAGGIFANANLLVTLQNTILYNPGSSNANRSLLSAGNNIDSDGTANLGDPLDGIDPLLLALANNGGFIPTHALQAGSAAINAGSVVRTPVVDQRGYGRNGSTDIGAFEFNGISPNQSPIITSNGGGSAATVTISENTTVVTTVAASDPDSSPQPPVYSIIGGADATKFIINSTTGALSFVVAPDFETPADANLDNVYGVIVQVSDGSATDSQAIAVAVTDGGTLVVDTVTDVADGNTSSIAALLLNRGADGRVSLREAILATDNTPNTEGVNRILFDLSGAGSYTITITSLLPAITDSVFIDGWSDPNFAGSPVVTLDGAMAGVNVDGLTLASNGTIVRGLAIENFSGDGIELTGSGNSIVDNIITLNAGNGVVVTGIGATGNSIQRNRIDANGQLGIDLGDDGVANNDLLDLDLGSNGGQNFPVLTSAVAINGNITITGTLTSGLLGSDYVIEFFGTPVADGSGYGEAQKLIGSIVVTTDLLGVASFNATFVGVGAGVGEFITGTATDVNGNTSEFAQNVVASGTNNPPVINSDGGGATASVSVAENQTAVTIVLATDPDQPAQQLTYSIIGGADSARFSIDTNTGALSFQLAPDFEVPSDSNLDNTYDVIVQVTDGTLTDTQTIAVSVMPVNESSPVIVSDGGGASASMSINENLTAVTTVNASDTDMPAQTLTYTISGGADADQFTIDSVSGALSFVDPVDYENPTDANLDNVYDVIIQVSDGNGGADTQTISVTINQVNDNAPVITSDGGGTNAVITINENATLATTVSTTDTDLPAQTLTFSIIGGADAGKFTIDPSSGVLSFLAAPDYENPTDANLDNIYDVIIQVSDGSLTDSQTLAVTVDPLNDNTPVITANGGGNGANVNVSENDSVVATISATDADLPAQLLTYSIIGGADASAFTIDANSGLLSFLVAPDYESPDDSDGDNVYNVVVQVSDGNLFDTQSIQISIDAVNDIAPTITFLGGGPVAFASVEENQTNIAQVTATDTDLPGQSLTFAIIGGADAARFFIDATTGQLSFVTSASFASPIDADGDNVYQVMVQASDGSLSVMQTIQVTVTPKVTLLPVPTSPVDDITPNVLPSNDSGEQTNDTAEPPASKPRNISINVNSSSNNSPANVVTDTEHVTSAIRTAVAESASIPVSSRSPLMQSVGVFGFATKPMPDRPKPVVVAPMPDQAAPDMLDEQEVDPDNGETSVAPVIKLPFVGTLPLPLNLDVSQLQEQLDKLEREVDNRKLFDLEQAAVVVTVLASAGYVLLSGRSLVFLLSLLTSRPLWKRFDPIEVLFAWEEEQKAKKGKNASKADRETLQSLVGAKK